MKPSLLLASTLISCFAAQSAHAICTQSKPYSQELDSADTILIVTITSATLSQPSSLLRSRREYEITFGYEVIETLKGDASTITKLSSRLLYHGPNDRDWRMAEEARWTPGDNVLVVANGSGEVDLSFCSLSRPLADEAAKIKSFKSRHGL